jgi:hypothetical protein
MRILALDADVHGPGVDNDTFRSLKSILEYDVVFWDPSHFADSYTRDSWNPTYQGQPVLSPDESARLVADVLRRRKEIASFLEMGRVFVVFSTPPSIVHYATGESKTSGTGRNAKTINTVAPIDVAGSCIPVSYEASPGVGESIDPKDDGFRAVWRADQSAWYYRAIFHKPAGTVIATVAGTDKAVASIFRGKGGGILLMLPAIYPVIEDEDEEEDEGGDGGEDGKKDEVSSSILNWIVQLKGGKAAEQPVWLDRYRFSEDVDRSDRIRELDATLARVADEIETLKAAQAAADQWKLLFTASGNALEEQAKKALEVIGFSVQSGPPGRTDLKLEWDGRQAVAEVKGVGKSATEGNAAQLEKWISEERISGVQNPKGILIVNGWRNMPLEDRNQETFPHQMRKFCEQREHCLLTGLQLLAMARTVEQDPGRSPEIARSIMETVGVMPGWQDLSIFVSQPTGEIEEVPAGSDTAVETPRVEEA